MTVTDFTFVTAPRVVFEASAAARLGEIAGSQLGDRVLVVTDPGLAGLGLPDPAVESLSADAEITVFAETEADPSRATLEKVVALAQDKDATGIVGFGGGSSLDVAKLAALLAGSGEELDGAWGVDNAKGPRLPLVLVPTTAGTGSEVTPVSIMTLRGDEKRGVSSPLLVPDIAVLDLDLTLGLPAATTAATGIDAMVHAIEAYASTSANNNPVSKALAEKALELLGRNIERAVRSPEDREARGAMLLGSMLAGQAFANSPVAAVHALAYPVGGRYHVPHGLSNALVLAPTLKFNAADPSCGAHRTYAHLAPFAFPDLGTAGEGEQAVCARFIERLAALSLELGLPTRLRDVDIPRDALPSLAADAMKQERLLVNNPRALTEADALSIYEAAW